MIRGYHEYKDIWEATVGDKVQCQRKMGNPTANVLAGNDDSVDCAKGPLGSGKLLLFPFLKFLNKDRLSSRDYRLDSF